MHLISKRNLLKDAAHYPDLEKTIKAWCKAVQENNWQRLIDIQAIYPTAESVGNFTVFNIKGNTYRLIVDIQYQNQTIYYKYLLTHSEYDKGQWKNDPYF